MKRVCSKHPFMAIDASCTLSRVIQQPSASSRAVNDFPEFSSSILSHFTRRLLMVLMIPLTTQRQNEFQARDEKLNRRLNSQIYDDNKQVSMLSALKTKSRGSCYEISRSLDGFNINYFAETSCNNSNLIIITTIPSSELSS